MAKLLRHTLLLVGVAAALPLLSGFIGGKPKPKAKSSHATDGHGYHHGHGVWSNDAPRPAERIRGMWSKFTPGNDTDPTRFYYFHDGGIGLFRYGKRGLNQTNSYTYQVDDKTIRFRMVKSGDVFESEYSVDKEGNATWLTIKRDPRMGGEQRYKYVPAPAKVGYGYGANADKDHPFARLWIQTSKDSKGQETFRLYQLEAPTLDGRGIGWYHEGNYEDWTTEALSYRKTDGKLELYFPVRDERITTRMNEGRGQDGKRFIHLAEDPRNFWHPRSYKDGGPGFTALIEGGPVPYRVHLMARHILSTIPGHRGGGQGRACPH